MSLCFRVVCQLAKRERNLAGRDTNPIGILVVDTLAPAAPTVALASDTGSSSSEP